ncbi:MAG: protein-export chaperone SecB [Candidatus Ozemobacteraceae bacterium]
MKPSDFQFLGYKVSKVLLEISDDYQAADTEISLNVVSTSNLFPENPRFVESILEVKIEEKNKKIKLLLILKGGFQAHAEMPEAIFKNLTDVNAPTILFPFARAIIASYTAQAGIMFVNLPLMNFTKKEFPENPKTE